MAGSKVAEAGLMSAADLYKSMSSKTKRIGEELVST